MNKIKVTTSAIKHFGLLILIASSSALYSQCNVHATVSQDTICGGNSILLSATGSCGIIMEDNFNTGVIGSLWISTAANPVFTNPCGPGPNGIHAWIGTTNSSQRTLEITNHNVANGNCIIEWDMRYGRVQSSGSCEDPDSPNEGVHLQYSINNGVSWTDFPGPNVLPIGANSTAPPFITTTSGSGGFWPAVSGTTPQSNNAAYFWHRYSCVIPPVASTANTKIRWAQLSASMAGWDSWGIDEVKLACPSGNVNVLWNTGDTIFNPGAIYLPPHPNNLPYDTCFIITISDTINSATDTICVHVNPTTIVSFTGLSSSYCMNSTSVTLTGTPSGGTFSGNGISGNSFSPFSAGVGTHNIIYTYSNGLCSNTDTQSVIINPLPNVSFTGLDTAYCKNAATAILTGIPSGGTFNGSGITGNVFNPSSINPGVYSIVYSYTDANACSNSQTKNTHINSVPIANAGTNITIQYNSNATLFGSASTGSGLYSYSWSPADSLVFANVQNPTTINLKSTNLFILTVTDLMTGCQDTSHTKVIVASLQISAFVNAFPQTICSGNSSQLVAYASGGSGIYSYSWASNPVGFNSTIANPVVYPSVSTTYTVTVSSGSNSTTATSFVIVNQTPNVSFTGLLNSYCINSQAVTLMGNPSGGNFIGNGIIGNTFNPSTAGVGSHQIVYSFANTFGCFNKDTQIVIINSLPTVNFSGLAQSYCTNSTPDTLSETPIGGTFSGTGITGNTFNPSIAGPGFFNIIYSYTDANACSNSITQTTVVYPIPIANAGANKSIPCSSSGTMIGSGSTSGFSYSWLPITGLSNPNIANPIASPSITTIYTLTITNNTTACYATDDVIVAVTGGPTATSSPDTSVCGGALINLAASGGISYSWSTGDTIPNISVYPITTTNYSVTVTDAYGCSDADTTTVSVFPLTIVNLGNDTTIKMSDTITLNAGAGFVSYLWNTNLITQTQLIDGPTLGKGIFTFYVDVIDSNQCSNSDTIEITIIDDTGLDIKSNNSQILIYPNPAKDLLYIKFRQKQKKSILINIIDSQGKLVFNTQLKSTIETPFKINIRNYPAGLYFIKVQGKTFIRNKKIIVY